MKKLLPIIFALLFAACAQVNLPDGPYGTGHDDQNSVNTLDSVNPASGNFGDANYPTQLYNSLTKERANENTEYQFGNFVYIGTLASACLGATAAGLTHTPGSCIAYNANYRATETGSITYGDNRTTWVAMDENTTGNNAGLPNFTRVGSTHYLIDSIDATQPAMVSDSQLLMKVTTAGGAITAVNDYRSIGTQLPKACIAGVCPVTNFGVVCDGSTDNTATLQLALNAAEAIVGTGTGRVTIPASCNASSGHQLVIASNVTIPDGVALEGLSGQCRAGVTTNCVEIDYSGSGVALSNNGHNGQVIKNIRIKNTGTGTVGIDFAGTFETLISGVSVEGFTTGILMEDSSTGSSNYNHVFDTYMYKNGTNLWIKQSNSGKSANSNIFTNVHAITPTTNSGESLHLTGSAHENVFYGLDVSCTGTGAGTNLTGLLVDASSGRDTLINGMTAEGCATVFNLGASVINFSANAVDGGFFNGSNGTDITADSTATYGICWGVLGNAASECDYSKGNIRRGGYLEPYAVQDNTGQAGVGQLTNLILRSEALDNASWSKVNPAAQTIGADGAVAPNGTTTAETVTLAGNGPGAGGNAFVRQAFANGGSIQNTCFTFTEWFKLDGASAGTPPPYWQVAMQDGGTANGSAQNYPLTSNWTRGSTTNCFPSSVSTSVLAYGVFVNTVNNEAAQTGVIVDVWGMQLSKSAGPIEYVSTAATNVPSTGVGYAVRGVPVIQAATASIAGGGALAAGSNSYVGTVTSVAATNNVVTPGFTCPTAVVLIPHDLTDGSAVTITASNTTTATFSATAGHSVDYIASCR